MLAGRGHVFLTHSPCLHSLDNPARIRIDIDDDATDAYVANTHTLGGGDRGLANLKTLLVVHFLCSTSNTDTGLKKKSRSPR